MIAARTLGSTFPPDKTATVVPDGAGSTAPVISAATLLAPAPSATNLLLSINRTIAAAIESSSTAVNPSTHRLTKPNVSSPGRLTAIPSAIVLGSDVLSG